MENTLYSMEKIFRNLIQKYPNKWNGFEELDELKNCLINYYNNIGVVFKENRIDVEFSKYGHQNPYE